MLQSAGCFKVEGSLLLMMDKKYGLRHRHWQTILHAILEVLLPGQTTELWLFGSRARGDFSLYSDIDLLLKATPILTDRQISAIRDVLEESDLPFKCHVVDAEKICPPYQEIIEKEKLLLAMLPF